MSQVLRKYGLNNQVTRGIVLFVLTLLLYSSVVNPNVAKDVSRLENIFQNKVTYLEGAIDEFSNAINYGDALEVIWENTRKFRNLGYDYFVFHEDSLLFWTSNQVSIKTNQIREVEQGVLLLENGWYYKTVRTSGKYNIFGIFLIKHEFPYENENLINDFSPDFKFDYQAKIEKVSAEKDIHFSNGSFAFGLSTLSPKPPGLLMELILFFGFLVALSVIFYGVWLKLTRFHLKRKRRNVFLGVFGLIVIRTVFFIFNWKQFFEDFTLTDPSVFASSQWSPTLADLMLNVLCLVLFVELFLHVIHAFFLKLEHQRVIARLIFMLSLSLFFLASHWTTSLITNIIYNSDVPLDFYNFMSLTPISFLFLVIFFAILWAYFRFSSSLIQESQSMIIPANQKGAIWFLLFVIYFILEVFVFGKSFLVGALPLVLSIMLLFFDSLKKSTYRFTEVIGLLVLFSLYLSVLLNHTQNQKELSNREIYAKKLISEKELETELEYAYTADLLQASPTLIRFLNDPDIKQVADVKRHIERKYFQNYWSRYEIDLHLYDRDSSLISTYVPIVDDAASRIDDLIRRVGVASDVSDFIYYVSDFSDNLSYVVRQPIFDSLGDNLGFLYLGLRSKVIPQEIGFPRLLLNANSKVFFKLEEYNMAKYVHGKLALRYGSFNYPRTIGSFLIDLPYKSGVVADGDYVHLITHGESNKTIILTKERVDFEEYLTTFSFLFSTFGLILILSQIINGKIFERWKTMKLAFRIQLLFIALVFFSLLFSGIGTGTYVKQQYLEYQEGLLREKVSSVQKELLNKLSDEDSLDEVLLTNYLEYLLNKFSSVFVTDINLYNTRGMLLASSRPEIFNLGLLSSQMNARAFRQMYNRKLSLYVNQEEIGNQAYLSAYVPLINANNNVIAYINLPYFARQNDFENEIAGFLSAIVNIFVLLLALSVVIAVFISSKIVDPLKQIQASLSGFKLGKSQQPIAYKGNDEIGVLVQEYNTKLKELQESSEKLAKTEREMAWREMAKQVAHEIKNPLTPMKLRIQHFQRAFDPEAQDAPQRIQQFSESLIEQIDALTNIANAFSNFAKMPKAQFEKVNLVRILQSVVDTFSAEQNILLSSEFPKEVVQIEGDKELLLRVFNNLVKNAIQAIPQESEGQILVSLQDFEQHITVQVKDNGIGIAPEMHDKIFVPNFTTKSTGAGLGLAMVKQIVESHYGSIHFVSQPKQTIFTIQLPKQQI